jgi:Leucine-rich repeat (LRR) protein
MAEHKKLLNENLDKLELIIQNPRSYLTYYLNDLRNEIDTSFKQRRMNETNEKQRNLLNITWLEMIQQIDLFEKDLFTTNLINFKLIEKHDFKQIKTHSLNNNNNDSIENELFKIEKYLFRNKTITFLTRKHCQMLNLINESNVKTLVGKLLIITDEYLRPDWITNDNNSIELLNNQKLKLKELKNKLTLTNAIDEIELTMHNLQILYLNNKNLKEIYSKTFQGLTKLSELYLNKNKIKIFESNTFKEVANLKKLNISFNKLFLIHFKTFETLHGLEELYASNNNLKLIDSLTFVNLFQLRVLDLSKNKIKYIDIGLFKSVYLLEELNLSWNQLTSLNANLFYNLSKLKELYLNNNEIVIITQNLFNGLLSLQKLYLNCNKIEKINGGTFNGLFDLQEVDLSSNLFIEFIDSCLFIGMSKNVNLIIKNRMLN